MNCNLLEFQTMRIDSILNSRQPKTNIPTSLKRLYTPEGRTTGADIEDIYAETPKQQAAGRKLQARHEESLKEHGLCPEHQN